MTNVKAQEMSLDHWHELLQPYGYADITVTAPAVRFQVPPALLGYEIHIMLKGWTGDPLREWAERSYMLEQAQRVVQLVQGRGYVLEDAPNIEFGGRYVYRMRPDATPDWVAEATLRFSMRAR